MRRSLLFIFAWVIFAASAGTFAADAPTREEAVAAMRKAAGFFHGEVASGGGYVWRYSADLELRQGEGVATKTVIWVQPPGTPTVGMVYLDAYGAAGDRFYLQAARDTAAALLMGQLRTGGWFYHVELDPEKRLAYAHRDVPARKKQQAKTMLDDDTTQAAVRFLMKLDKTLEFSDEKLHEAVGFALDALRAAQFPNGAWYAWWDEHPQPKSAEEYPLIPATYPESWPRTWGAKYTGCYVTNDNLMADMIAVMLLAREIYGDERYLQSAERAGDFLILAQMPDPQPAWAQQYDQHMHPVWARKFEPPAITGSESQGVMEALLDLYRATGDEKYLAPVPRAIAYFRKSYIAEGRLARFYELETNRPLYFERYGDRYDLGYEITARLPDHYAFVVGSKLDRIEAEYQALAAGGRTPKSDSPPKLTDRLAADAARIMAAQDARGAWTEPGWVRNAEGRKVEPPGGIIQSATFVKNMEGLAKFVRASR